MMVEDIRELPEQSFGLEQLDLKLRPYLNFNGGFFVDVGARDGVAYSNTLYFERYRKWRGLLIEANPEQAKQCMRNRPRSSVENCALVPFEYDRAEVEVPSGGRPAQAPRRWPETDPTLPGGARDATSCPISVRAETLTAVLARHRVPVIDFLCLNVGGSEAAVLRGLHFEVNEPGYLLVEARDEVDQLLTPFYEKIADLTRRQTLYKSKRRIRQESGITTKSPVAFILFNRPALTARVFARIAEVKPPELFLIADGPRSREERELCEETRRVVEKIDWPCQVRRRYARTNLGCRERIFTGLNWVFSRCEQAIVLEDDCLPEVTFFSYCDALLELYRRHPRVAVISGNNFQFGRSRTESSYYFSIYPHCWGWATWRRAWRGFDRRMRSWPRFRDRGAFAEALPEADERRYWTDIFDRCYRREIDSWAYPWTYTCWLRRGLTALPDVNLVANLGFGGNATHTLEAHDPLANLPTGQIWQLRHPPQIEPNELADQFTFRHVLKG